MKIKKIIIILMLTTILISGCKEDFINPVGQGAMFKCNEDSDCIKVKADCCGCTADGTAMSINKIYEESMNKYYREICKVECRDRISDHPSCSAFPKCVQGKCVLKGINE